MMAEMNRDWYCSGLKNSCVLHNSATKELERCLQSDCSILHRKWPTPEQFRKEYGFKWEGPVWVKLKNACNPPEMVWLVFDMEYAKKALAKGFEKNLPTICACTPWGKPPDWFEPEA